MGAGNLFLSHVSGQTTPVSLMPIKELLVLSVKREKTCADAEARE